jgi:hypothetical protein
MYDSNRLKIPHTKKAQYVKGRGSQMSIICGEFGHAEERGGAQGPNATGFDVGYQQVPSSFLDENHGAVLRSHQTGIRILPSKSCLAGTEDPVAEIPNR